MRMHILPKALEFIGQNKKKIIEQTKLRGSEKLCIVNFCSASLVICSKNIVGYFRFASKQLHIHVRFQMKSLILYGNENVQKIIDLLLFENSFQTCHSWPSSFIISLWVLTTQIIFIHLHIVSTNNVYKNILQFNDSHEWKIHNWITIRTKSHSQLSEML